MNRTHFLFCAATIVLCGYLARVARAQSSAPESVLFAEFPQVHAATLHPSSLNRAPAMVSVITDEQIRRYGYRTLAEALNNEVGFLMTTDHAYSYLGVRGFGLPGDYGSRLLLMVNGHALSEPIYGTAAYYGQEFGVDMEIVKRIEVIRGPTSASYGSSGVFATVNVVTKTPEEMARISGSAVVGSGRETGAHVASAIALGGASLLVSVRTYGSSGDALPITDGDQTRMRRHDGERGSHAFLNFRWNAWDVTAMLTTRRKELPVGWEDEPFSGAADTAWDRPNYVDATYSREVGARSTLTWRSYYNWFSYLNRNVAEQTGALLSEDICRSSRIGSRLTHSTDFGNFGTLTIGAEGNLDPQIVQQNRYLFPAAAVMLDSREPDVSSGLFVQWERDVTERLRVVAGARHDWSRAARQFVSPRAALIFEASPRSTYKVMFGRAFRNPNAYELYYSWPNYQLPSVNLRPEYANTLEFAADHKFNRVFSAGASSYWYEIGRLIEFNRAMEDMWQFGNSGRGRASGVEWRAQARISNQAEFFSGGSVGRVSGRNGAALPNSPEFAWKTRASAPIVRSRLTGSVSFRHVSSRRTTAGEVLPGFGLWDLAVTTFRLRPNFDLQFGVSNLLDKRYSDPSALSLDAVPAQARKVYLRLLWGARD